MPYAAMKTSREMSNDFISENNSASASAVRTFCAFGWMFTGKNE